MIECRDMHIADEKVNTAMKESGTSYPSRQQEQPPPQNGKELDSEASKIQAMTALPHERNKFIEVTLKPNIFLGYYLKLRIIQIISLL